MKVAVRYALSALVLSFGVAHAQIVDQSDTTNVGALAGFYQTDLAQSFQQSASDIDGAAIFLAQPFGDDGLATTISIQLWNLLPNQTGATMLTQGSVNLTGDGQWAQVAWSDLSITANQTYYLVFQSTDTSYGIAGDTHNGYPRGNLFANSGYSSFPNYDYTFETFKAPPAPEPMAWVLLGAGAAALVLRRRQSPLPVA
ncbi:MAG: PEP-CTERM sorting domain-containing protein [Fimbriimonadaceae bacterium]